MSEPRSDLIVAEASGDVAALRDALSSTDPTIRAAALGGLKRLGELTTDEISTGLIDSDAAVRCRAIELVIDVPAIEILHMLNDPDDLVVETTAWALGERGNTDEGTVRRLREIATSHDISICREAAVAALGAIGAPSGLPAILAAMADRAPVRRRAVLALAPFAGDDVDAALVKALQDRDRQVRQAAEDLLGT